MVAMISARLAEGDMIADAPALKASRIARSVSEARKSTQIASLCQTGKLLIGGHLLSQDYVNVRFISQSDERLLIVGNSHDPNVCISLRQLFEGTAQLCIYSKDQDTDHCAH
jgi:hypothetical protein